MSVWIGHLRDGDPTLSARLDAGSVLMHPYVLGELALGNLRARGIVLGSMAALPQAVVATPAEVLELIERSGLSGRGVGYVDAHLLASIRLTPGSALWTADVRLRALSEELGLAAGPSLS